MRHAVGRDQQHAGGQRVGDPGDHPAQPRHPGRGVTGPRPGHPDRGREARSRRAGERDRQRRGHAAVRHLGQQVGRALGHPARGARVHAQQGRGGHDRAAEERHRRDEAAQHLGGGRGLPVGRAGPAVALGDQQPGAAQVGADGLPELVVVGLRRLDARERLVEPAPVGEQGRQGV